MESFTQILQSKGAREFQIVALSGDEPRALAAVAEAERRGIEHVIAYALTLYDDPSWVPTGAKSRAPALTNQSVDRKCAHCGGDRFVPVTEGPGLYEETYAPCVHCNAEANTTRYDVYGNVLRTAAR